MKAKHSSWQGGNTRKPTLTHYLEYLTARAIGFLGSLVPKFLWGPCSRGMARLWYHVFPYRRGLVLENIGLAFPEQNFAWRKNVARGSYAHFVRMMLFEYQYIARHRERTMKELMDPEPEGLEEILERGVGERSILVLGGHIGNWEMAISYFCGVLDFRATAVFKPMHNPLVEKHLSKLRAIGNWNAISTKNLDGREFIRAIRNKDAIVMLADQDARSSGLFTPFFGVPASTSAGPARLAFKMQLPVIYVSCLRGENGKYKTRFETFKPLGEYAAEKEEAVKDLTAEYLEKLEGSIRKAPEQYFWFHKRWKTQPPGK